MAGVMAFFLLLLLLNDLTSSGSSIIKERIILEEEYCESKAKRTAIRNTECPKHLFSCILNVRISFQLFSILIPSMSH